MSWLARPDATETWTREMRQLDDADTNDTAALINSTRLERELADTTRITEPTK